MIRGVRTHIQYQVLDVELVLEIHLVIIQEVLKFLLIISVKDDVDRAASSKSLIFTGYFSSFFVYPVIFITDVM